MIKYFLFGFTALACCFSMAQEIPAKFKVAEKLISRECQKAEDQYDCIYKLFQHKILTEINTKESSKVLKKFKKDSLKLELKFTVNSLGDIVDSTTTIKTSRFKNSQKLSRGIKEKVITLPRFLVQNRKPIKFASYHTLSMVFVRSKESDTFEITAPKDVYKGGIVEEAPRFPGCQNIDQELYHRQCFQKMMQNHLRRNFKYPENALKQKLSGVVYIAFKINENGEVDKLRTKGPHPILEKEARRIISLLPKLVPGKKNGITSEYPFSIPITFRLQ